MHVTPEILIIYTGGTIGMKAEFGNEKLVPDSFESILLNLPDLHKLNCNIKVHSLEKIIDSSDMNPSVWLTLADIIEENYSKVDGFVVLHGTYTMAFTASALSFLFENLNKPVVFTGSQLPISAIRTDAKENLLTAIEIAIAEKDGCPAVPEVCIYFDNKLLRGNRAFKYNSFKFEAFRSPNYPALAESGVHLKFNYGFINKPDGQTFKIHKNIMSKVASLKLFPGINNNVIEAIINSEAQGIIIETFGAGNTTTDTRFNKIIEQAIIKGKVILNISQCNVGSVEQGKYETSCRLRDIGVANGYDLTYEAAITKMMFALGQKNHLENIVDFLETNIRGELTRFLN